MRVVLRAAFLCACVAAGLQAQEAAAPEPGAVPAAALPQAEPRTVVGAPRGRPLSGAALETRTQEVSSLLRCPVCQGLSVADSHAGTAQAMKAQAREMLAAGFDQEQVLAYFEHSYGGFVRLQPPLRGVNWLVWLLPVLGLVAGGFVVLRLLRGPGPVQTASGKAGSAPVPEEDLPGPDTLPDDPGLARSVLRVRELAYGWPGGVAPKKEEPR